MPEPTPASEVAINLGRLRQRRYETAQSFRLSMNEMEASVHTNGEFFVKVGSADAKSSINLGLGNLTIDTRALILKEGRLKGPEGKEIDLVARTAKGPKLITMTILEFRALVSPGTERYGYGGGGSTRTSGSILGNTGYITKHPVEETLYLEDTFDDSIRIWTKDEEGFRDFPVRDIPDTDKSLVSELMSKSIEIAKK